MRFSTIQSTTAFVLTGVVLLITLMGISNLEPKKKTLSVVTIASNPELYNDTIVEVMGFCNFTLEGVQGLYAENFPIGDPKVFYQVISLDMPGDNLSPVECRDGHGRFVKVTGRFRVTTFKGAQPARGYIMVGTIEPWSGS